MIQKENAEALHTVTARFFKGLGDPVRLRVLQLLDGGERSVGEIVDHLGLPQNQVSMHLGCLRWCGYVKTRREGRRVYYALADPRVMEVLRLARDIVQGSEAYLIACEVLGSAGESDENLSNVTGWRNRSKASMGAGLEGK